MLPCLWVVHIVLVASLSKLIWSYGLSFGSQGFFSKLQPTKQITYSMPYHK